MSIENLNEDLNAVAQTDDPALTALVLSLLESDLNVIQKLDDEPNDVGGLTAAELKAKFDEAGNVIKKYINETLIPSVSDTVAEAEVRAAAEAERVAGEKTRVSNESTRVSREKERRSGETTRLSGEQARVAAENARVSAEQDRKSAESARAAAETAREDKETGYVAQAKYWAEQAKEVAAGDFAPSTHAAQHGKNGSDPVTPAAIGAVPTGRKVNGKDLSADITLGVADISGAVPDTRKVNGKALSADLSLTAADVGALAESVPVCADCDAEIKAGGTKTTLKRQTADTLNSPYKAGLTSYSQGLILTYAFSSAHGIQYAFPGGSIFMRSYSSSAVGEWKKAATTDKALLADGSNPGTGMLNFKKVENGYGVVQKNHTTKADQGLQLIDYDGSGSRLGLSVSAKDQKAYVVTGSTQREVLHIGNRDLVVPVYTAAVTTAWTASGSWFYQDITEGVAGILGTDNPIVSVQTGSDNGANVNYQRAFANVFRVETANNSIRLWAAARPACAFQIRIQVVK